MRYALALLFILAMSLSGSSRADITTIFAGKSGAGVPLTPCGALQLDFTDVTGCNAVGIPLIHL